MQKIPSINVKIGTFSLLSGQIIDYLTYVDNYFEKFPRREDMKQEDPTPETMGQTGTSNTSQSIPGTLNGYLSMCRDSNDNREEYWDTAAKRLFWNTPYNTVVEENFEAAEVEWFLGGKINAAASLFKILEDRHSMDDEALVFIGDDGNIRSFSYGELIENSKKSAAVLQSQGLSAGDRVALFLPDCPETVFIMLGASLAGISYVPVPHYFTAEIASEIINDSGAALLITGRNGYQSYNGRVAELIENVSSITKLSLGDDISGTASFTGLMDKAATAFEPVIRDSGDPLFILYANSAAGIPRGSVFCTGGFIVNALSSHDLIFGNCGGESCFTASTLNLASAAGQAYALWGALLSGRGIMLAGDGENAGWTTVATMLDGSRKLSLLTSPRLLNTLKQSDDKAGFDGSCRFETIACAGEVLYPRLISFAAKELTSGPEKILNLWIQSESGAAAIATLPAAELNKSGSLGLPLPAISAKALNTIGNECRLNESGQLVFRQSWPGMIKSIWNQEERFKELYFSRIPGYFATNDAVRIDQEGFYWFMGRLDDVVKVRGHSLATSEIEAVILGSANVAEAAVVSSTDTERDSLTAFISLADGGIDPEDNENIAILKKELSELITRRIGEFAVPEKYFCTRELPRTRTGKLLRRVLRRIASGDMAHDEDLGHVANPEAVSELVRKHQ